MGDAVDAGNANIFCGSSTDLSMFNGAPYDLVITDPPFNNRIYYADLSDFFYVWMRLALLKWYSGMPERKYLRAGTNSPRYGGSKESGGVSLNNREPWEKSPFLTASILEKVPGTPAPRAATPHRRTSRCSIRNGWGS